MRGSDHTWIPPFLERTIGQTTTLVPIRPEQSLLVECVSDGFSTHIPTNGESA